MRKADLLRMVGNREGVKDKLFIPFVIYVCVIVESKVT